MSKIDTRICFTGTTLNRLSQALRRACLVIIRSDSVIGGLVAWPCAVGTKESQQYLHLPPTYSQKRAHPTCNMGMRNSATLTFGKRNTKHSRRGPVAEPFKPKPPRLMFSIFRVTKPQARSSTSSQLCTKPGTRP